MEPITETAEVFRTGLEMKLMTVTDERELAACADMLNSADFDRLPLADQTELAMLYSEKHFKVTGALLG